MNQIKDTYEYSEGNPIQKQQQQIDSSNIKNDQQIQMFKNNNIHIFCDIQLQNDIQGFLLVIKIQSSIKNNKQLKKNKWTFRYQKILDISENLISFQGKINNLDTENCNKEENDRIRINDYLQELRDELLIIENMKDEYIKSFKMHGNQFAQNINYPFYGNLIFDIFQKDDQNSQDQLNDLNYEKDHLFKCITENKLFLQKQRNENTYVTLFEVLIKQGYNLKSSILLRQYKKIKSQFDSEFQEYQDLYLQAFAQVYSLESQNQFDGQLELINQSIQSNNKYPKSLYLRGIIQFDKNDYQGAIKTFTECVRLDSEYVDAFNALGNCYKQLNNYDQAKDLFMKALNLDPNSPKSFIGIASILKERKQFQDAVQQYERTIQIDPKNPDALCGLGISLYYQQKYKQSIKIYDQAIKIDPHFIKAFINKGCSLDSLEQYEQAIIEYQKAIDLRPQDKKLQIQLCIRKGLSHHNFEEYQQAINMFNQAINLDPNNTQIYEHKGKTLYSCQRYDEALQIYDQILNIDRYNLNGHLGRGLLLLKLQRPLQQAKQEFEECIRIDKTNQLASQKLNQINRSLQQI